MFRFRRSFVVLALFSILASRHLAAADPPAEPSGASARQGGGPGDRAPRLLFPALLLPASESRIGFLRHTDEAVLRLDIGNSVDLFRIAGARNFRLEFGVDVATWTALREEENFHFPVDAVDYLFGVNVSSLWRWRGGWSHAARLRLSHISAHLVDGRYDKTAGAWRDDHLPRVYSREYLELVQALRYRDQLRLYAGAQYLYHVDPPRLGSWVAFAGAEGLLRIPRLSWLHPYAAVECRLARSGAYAATNTGQFGLKFGRAWGAGVAVYAQYTAGLNEHGEFFDARDSFWAPGLRVDF
jgi:hypothetical protein